MSSVHPSWVILGRAEADSDRGEWGTEGGRSAADRKAALRLGICKGSVEGLEGACYPLSAIRASSPCCLEGLLPRDSSLIVLAVRPPIRSPAVNSKLVDDDGSIETALMNYLFAKQVVNRLRSQVDVSDLQRKRSYWKQCAFNAVSCFGK
ncbi:unnamed protein product [Nezara viridula]|uniref:Neuropeptide n=1 Tax=Nezara viridula TaxID=85310 RepID=A0A9P0MUZ2_NEZVI|nr:unnamed protein product [Nezara viridula]